MSIVRVGLSNQKFSDGYDAIFGGKKKKATVKVKKTTPKSKKPGKKKK